LKNNHNSCGTDSARDEILISNKKGESMFNKNGMSRTAMAALLGTALIAQPLLAQRVFAGGGDFSADFTAAAP
jgi:hypothetical protein